LWRCKLHSASWKSSALHLYRVRRDGSCLWCPLYFCDLVPLPLSCAWRSNPPHTNSSDDAAAEEAAGTFARSGEDVCARQASGAPAVVRCRRGGGSGSASYPFQPFSVCSVKTADLLTLFSTSPSQSGGAIQPRTTHRRWTSAMCAPSCAAVLFLLIQSPTGERVFLRLAVARRASLSRRACSL
jgi:hypothetical protein